MDEEVERLCAVDGRLAAIRGEIHRYNSIWWDGVDRGKSLTKETEAKYWERCKYFQDEVLALYSMYISEYCAAYYAGDMENLAKSIGLKFLATKQPLGKNVIDITNAIEHKIEDVIDTKLNYLQ